MSGIKACSQWHAGQLHIWGEKSKWLEQVSEEGYMAVRKVQTSLWGRGCKICAAAQAIRVTVTFQRVPVRGRMQI